MGSEMSAVFRAITGNDVALHAGDFELVHFLKFGCNASGDAHLQGLLELHLIDDVVPARFVSVVVHLSRVAIHARLAATALMADCPRASPALA